MRVCWDEPCPIKKKPICCFDCEDKEKCSGACDDLKCSGDEG